MKLRVAGLLIAIVMGSLPSLAGADPIVITGGFVAVDAFDTSSGVLLGANLRVPVTTFHGLGIPRFVPEGTLTDFSGDLAIYALGDQFWGTAEVNGQAFSQINTEGVLHVSSVPVLASERITAPFTFTGHITGYPGLFRGPDRSNVLFSVDVAGRGTLGTRPDGHFIIDSVPTFRMSTLSLDIEDTPAPTPEPATLLLLGVGVLGARRFNRCEM